MLNGCARPVLIGRFICKRAGRCIEDRNVTEVLTAAEAVHAISTILGQLWIFWYPIFVKLTLDNVQIRSSLI